MIDVHQNAALSESFEEDRSRYIGNRCKSEIWLQMFIEDNDIGRKIVRPDRHTRLVPVFT